MCTRNMVLHVFWTKRKFCSKLKVSSWWISKIFSCQSQLLLFRGCATVTTTTPSRWPLGRWHSYLTSPQDPSWLAQIWILIQAGPSKALPGDFLDWNWESRSVFSVSGKFNIENSWTIDGLYSTPCGTNKKWWWWHTEHQRWERLYPDGIQIPGHKLLVRTSYFPEAWLFNSSMDSRRWFWVWLWLFTTQSLVLTGIEPKILIWLNPSRVGVSIFLKVRALESNSSICTLSLICISYEGSETVG